MEIIGSGDTTTARVLRPFNRVYYPIGSDSNTQTCSSYQLQWQVSETFYWLKQSLGILPSAFCAVHISLLEYNDTQSIIGVDLEKSTDAAWSGLNTKAGDIVSADYMLEIRDNGCQISDYW